MRRSVIAVFLVAGLAATAATQERQPEHLLRLVFVTGQETRIEVANEVAAKIEMGNTPVEQKVSLAVTFTRTVREVTDKAARIAFRIDRVAYRVEGIDYDSDKDEDPGPVMKEFAAMIGESFVIDVDERGRRRKVEVPDAVQALNRQSESDFFTLVNVILPAAVELPENPVAVGARWKGAADPATKEEKYVEASDYELLSIEGGQARIRQELTVGLAEPGNEAKQKLGRRTTRLLTFDLARGCTVREETKELTRDDDTRAGIRVTAEIERTVRELPAKKEGADKG